MSNVDTEDRLAAIEREMRRGNPTLVVAPGTVGLGRVGRRSWRATAAPGECSLIMVAIATMQPIAWMPGVIGLDTWIEEQLR